MNTSKSAPKVAPLPCPFCGTTPRFLRIPASLAAPEIDRAFWSLSCRKNSECLAFPSASGDTKAEAVEAWNCRMPADLYQVPFTAEDKPPFVARNGRVVFLVEAIEDLTGHGFILIRGLMLEGIHFNDQGDYTPGDRVTIGPITDTWRRISAANPSTTNAA